MSGWIKLHRSIQYHWLYTEKRSFSRFEAWNDILLTVNYADAQTFIKGKLYTVKRGESILSLESWAKRWSWDKSKVRRFLNMLQVENMIELKGDNITTRLIVCKYEDYQDSSNANETQTKRKRHSNDIQTTPIKEEEENKEEKEEKEKNKINKKENFQIPSLNEFFFYAQSIPEFKNDFEQLKFSIQSKYETWVSDDWKDGHGIKIKNWKTKLKNTLPYLKKVNNGNTQQSINNEERRRSYIERVLHGSNEPIDSERSPTGKDDSAFDAVEIVES